MSFFSSNEESYGILPRPYTIKTALNLNLNSSEIEELYDNDPNFVARIKSENGTLTLKQFGWRNKLHFYLSPFRSSRAQRSWETANLLESSNVKTPKPLFVYTYRKFGFVTNNFFITEAINPHVKFRSFITSGESNDNIKKVIKDLAISVARMHNNGVIHRDLTTGNFLVDNNLNVFIVDLNRAKYLGAISTSQRLQDLSKIYFKDSDAYSQKNAIAWFFKHYTKESGIEIDLVEQYLESRSQMVKNRNRRKKAKKYFRSKFIANAR